MGGEICQFLEWDSQFFQRRIARVTVGRLTQDLAERIIGWCEVQEIDCLYLLAELSDETTIRIAEQDGFHLVDVRVTMARQLDADITSRIRIPRGSIRPAVPDDIPALRAIARVSHGDSRFCFDSNFGAGRANLLFETWIDKSCRGYADAVLVADVEGHPFGYVTCKLQEGAEGQVGLCGVTAEAQGQGFGQQLVLEALRWFAGRGIKRVTVVTQGRNSAAQRLYQRCGFMTESTKLWYHRWRQAKPMDAGR